ncbi:hypothetical protein BDR04DRAFT_1086918 [Suillus decipiens]|nr:hypothetical protein BDR04DRAFT_1086918 [Suillus decipiens]
MLPLQEHHVPWSRELELQPSTWLFAMMLLDRMTTLESEMVFRLYEELEINATVFKYFVWSTSRHTGPISIFVS